MNRIKRLMNIEYLRQFFKIQLIIFHYKFKILIIRSITVPLLIFINLDRFYWYKKNYNPTIKYEP